jgi:hypothetical protein
MNPKISVKTARDIDATNAAYVTVKTITETNKYVVRTDARGRGLWIDGQQVEGLSQFNAGKNANSAYRRWFAARGY